MATATFPKSERSNKACVFLNKTMQVKPNLFLKQMFKIYKYIKKNYKQLIWLYGMRRTALTSLNLNDPLTSCLNQIIRIGLINVDDCLQISITKNWRWGWMICLKQWIRVTFEPIRTSVMYYTHVYRMYQKKSLECQKIRGHF